MTTIQIILVIAIVAAIAIALLAAQRGAPRVTTIERKTERAGKDEEEGS
jgi:hypothetical protein